MNIKEYKRLYPDYKRKTYEVDSSDCLFSTIFPVDSYKEPENRITGTYRFYLLDYGIGTDNLWYATVPENTDQIIYIKPTVKIMPDDLLSINTGLNRSKPSKTAEEINWLKQSFNTVYIDRKYGEYQLSVLTNMQLLTVPISEYVENSGEYLKATNKLLEFAGKAVDYFPSSTYPNPVSVREFYFPVRSCSYLQILFSVPISVIESNDIPADPRILNLLTDNTKIQNVPITSKFLFTDSNVKKSLTYDEYAKKVSQLISDLRFINETNNNLLSPISINLELDIASLLTLVAGIQNLLSLNGLQFSESFGKILGLLEKQTPEEGEDIRLTYVNLDSEPLRQISVGVKQFVSSYSYNNQNIMYLLYNSEKINQYVNNLITSNIINGSSIATFFNSFYDKRAFTEDTLKTLENAQNSNEEVVIVQNDPQNKSNNTSENCTVQGNIQKLRDQYSNFTSLRNAIRSNVNSKEIGNPVLELLVGDIKEVEKREETPLFERIKEQISLGISDTPQARAWNNFSQYEINPDVEPAPKNPKETKLQKTQRTINESRDGLNRLKTKIGLGTELLRAFRVDELLLATYQCRIENLDPALLQKILSKYLDAKQKIENFINRIVCNDYVGAITKIPRFNVPGGLATSDPLRTITTEVSKALYNAIIDLFLIQIRGSLEAFKNNTCDTNNLANFNSDLSVGDLTADQEQLVGDILSQNGLDKGELSLFLSFLDDILCVLKPNEICLLLSGNTLGEEQRLILRSLIVNKYPTLIRYAENESLLLSLSKTIIEKLELNNLCLDILTSNTPVNRQFCDSNTLNNARRQLLEQKSLSEEQVNDLINAIKAQEEKEIENIVKLLNGDAADTLPNLLCTDESTQSLLGKIVNENESVQSIYSSLIKSMIEPAYKVYNQDIIDWPISQVTNEKLVKIKGQENFARPELIIEQSSLKFEDANKKENVKVIKHIAETFINSSKNEQNINNSITDNAYTITKFKIDPEVQYKLDYGLAYASINYQTLQNLQIDLKNKFLDFNLALITFLATSPEASINTVQNLVNGSNKIVTELKDQGAVGTVANAYDTAATFFDNINPTSLGYVQTQANALQASITKYRDFLEQDRNALVNAYAQYEVSYNYALTDTSKINTIEITRNGLKSYFTASEQQSIRFEANNPKDNRLEYLSSSGFTVVTDLSNVQKANKEYFTILMRDKSDKNKNYYLAEKPFSNADFSKYILAFNEVDKYKTFSNNFLKVYNEYMNLTGSAYNKEQDFFAKCIEAVYQSVYQTVNNDRIIKLRQSFRQAYNSAAENTDNSILDDIADFFGNDEPNREKSIYDSYISSNDPDNKNENFYDFIVEKEFITKEQKDSILGLDRDTRYFFKMHLLDLVGKLDDAPNAYPAGGVGNPSPSFKLKSAYYNAFQVLNGQQSDSLPMNQLYDFGKINDLFLRICRDKEIAGIQKENILKVFEELFFYSFSNDGESVFKNNSKYKFKIENPPSSLVSPLEQADVQYDRSLIETLQFVKGKSNKDKICNTNDNFLGLDQAQKNIKEAKQKSACYETFTEQPNSVSEESKIIIKEISKIIVRAYVYDFLLQGIVSFHDITPQAIKNDMLITFMLYKMRNEMSKLSSSYYDTFSSKLYELYTGRVTDNPTEKNLIMKQIISDEIDSFTNRYFDKNNGILVKSTFLNYINNDQNIFGSFKNLIDGFNEIIVPITNIKRFYSFQQPEQIFLNFIESVPTENYFIETINTQFNAIYETKNIITSNLPNLDNRLSIENIVKYEIERKIDSNNIKFNNTTATINGTTKSLSENTYNNLFDILFPIKDYYVFNFIISNLSTSVKKTGTSVFRDTHSALLTAYNNLINGTNSDIEVPLITSSNAPDSLYKFAKNALIKTPIMIAKGAVEFLDPNVATAKALSDYTKLLRTLKNPNAPEDKTLDLLIPTYGATLTSLGIAPTPIGIAYYFAGLWSSGILESLEPNESGNIPLTCEDENA